MNFKGVLIFVGTVTFGGSSLLYAEAPIQFARLKLGDVKKSPDSDESEKFQSVTKITYGIGLSALTLKPQDKEQFNTGNGAGLSLKMDINNRFGAEIFYGSYDQDVKETNRLFNGKMSVKPLMLNLKYSLNPDDNISPYLNGGFSYYQVDHEMDQDIRSLIYQFYGVDYNEQIQNAAGFHGGLGLDVFVRDRKINFNFDYKYLYVNADIEYTVKYGPYSLAGKSYAFNLGGHLLSAGVSLFF